MQIKTTMKYHFAPLRVLGLESLINTSVGKDLEKLVPLCTAGRNENSAAALENSQVVPHMTKQRVSIGCRYSAPRYTPQRNENDAHTKACT